MQNQNPFQGNHTSGITDKSISKSVAQSRLYDGYLTEPKLGDVLKLLFPDEHIVKQFAFNHNRRLKYDYALMNSKILVEFDGHYHYTDVSVSHDLKYNDAVTNGFELIRIPYFIQLTPAMVHHWFDIEMPTGISPPLFETGFVSPKVVLPSAFCNIGLQALKSYLDVLNEFDPVSILAMYDSLLIKISNVDSRIRHNRVEYAVPREIMEYLELLEAFQSHEMNIHVPITVICRTHGEFSITPYKHAELGVGCDLCR